MEISNFYVMPVRSSTRTYSRRKVRGTPRARPGMRQRSPQVGKVRYARRYRRAARAPRARWQNPLSIMRSVKFRYADTGFNATTGLLGIPTDVVHCSGPYDPWVDTGGVQPYDWDTIMNATEYTKYTVYACKVTVKFYFTGAPNTVVCSLLAINNPTITYTASDDLKVNPWCRQTTMNEISKGTATLSMYVPIHRITMRFPSDYIAAYNANPATSGLAFFHAVVDSTSMGAPVGVGQDWEIIYYCKVMRTDTMNES